jgi:hypothetical protein
VLYLQALFIGSLLTEIVAEPWVELLDLDSKGAAAALDIILFASEKGIVLKELEG